jgi:hypothetical protein
MIELTIEELGYATVLRWLRDDCPGERPTPPQELDAEQLIEWWRGSNEAYSDFPKYKALDDQRDEHIEDFIINLIKMSILLSSVYAVVCGDWPVQALGVLSMIVMLYNKMWRANK